MITQARLRRGGLFTLGALLAVTPFAIATGSWWGAIKFFMFTILGLIVFSAGVALMVMSFAKDE